MHTFPAIGGSQVDDVSTGPRHLGLGGGELTETMRNRIAACLSPESRFSFFPNVKFGGLLDTLCGQYCWRGT